MARGRMTTTGSQRTAKRRVTQSESHGLGVAGEVGIVLEADEAERFSWLRVRLVKVKRGWPTSGGR